MEILERIRKDEGGDLDAEGGRGVEREVELVCERAVGIDTEMTCPGFRGG
jgi:hypothetical protein